MKKLFKWGIIAVVVLGVIGAVAGGETGNTVEQASGKDKSGNTVEKAEEKKQQKAVKKTAGIGDTLNVSDVAFKVSSTKKASNVGGEFGVDAQGKFLIVDVAVTNNSDEAITIDSSFFKLKANGKSYEPSTESSIFANEAGSSFFLQSVNPGITHQGKIVFDVPQSVIDAKNLQLEVQTGFMGTDKGVINIAQ